MIPEEERLKIAALLIRDAISWSEATAVHVRPCVLSLWYQHIPLGAGSYPFGQVTCLCVDCSPGLVWHVGHSVPLPEADRETSLVFLWCGRVTLHRNLFVLPLSTLSTLLSVSVGCGKKMFSCGKTNSNCRYENIEFLWQVPPQRDVTSLRGIS